MKNAFVQTQNYLALRAAIKAAERRGAPEASIIVVEGGNGFGKSRSMDRIATDFENCYHLRAMAGWGKHRGGPLLRELAEVAGVWRKGDSLADMQRRVIAAIGHSRGLIVVDEAQFLIGQHDITPLECLRDITDKTEVPLILVGGVEDFRDRLSRYPAIASRVTAVVTFGRATPQDVALACKQLTDVEVADELVQRIHAESGGRMRLILNAIANVEIWAQRNQRNRAEAADVASVRLCEEVLAAYQPKKGTAK